MGIEPTIVNFADSPTTLINLTVFYYNGIYNLYCDKPKSPDFLDQGFRFIYFNYLLIHHNII
jgi:hypothetical protein